MNDTVIDGAPARPSFGKRLLSWPIVRIVLGIAFLLGPLIACQVLLRHFFPELKAPNAPLTRALISIPLTLMVLAFYVLYVRLIEKRAVKELALQYCVAETAVGLVIGTVLFSLVMGEMALFGGYVITGLNAATVMIVPLITIFISPVLEELLFRGVIFRIIQDSLGSGWALAISSAIFGAAHLFNPNATLFGAFCIAVEAGLLLGAVYMLTQRLWIAIGVHAAWNFVQGAVFSVPVSGFTSHGLFQNTIQGSPWLTGGDFGAEDSIPALVTATVAGIVFLVVARRRGMWVRPAWTRNSLTSVSA